MKRLKTQTPRRLKRVWDFAKPYTPLFLLAELCILVTYAVSLFLPQNLLRLTDQVLIGGEHGLLPEIIRNYAVLFLTAIVFNLIYAYTWQTLQNRYVVDVKNAVFERAVRSRASFLTHMNSGDIMSRIDGDSEQFLHVIQRNLFHFVNSILLCAGVVVMVARINLVIAGMLIVAAALPIVMTRLCGRLTERYARDRREVTGAFTGRLFEILKGFREIRLLCAERWASSQVLAPLRRLITLGNRTRWVDFLVGRGIYLVNLIASLVIYGYAAWRIYRGEMSVGQFLAVIDYVALMHKKFNWMLRIYLDWFSRRVSLDRVSEVLDTEEEPAGGRALPVVEEVAFEHVTFGYEEKPVLYDVSFSIRKGDKVAVVGASGAGKTTIMDLFLRLYDPWSGSVRINGEEAGAFSLADLRSRIGVVSQDIRLFEGSVRENLLLGRQGTDEELWEALRRVGLDELIRSLPAGLDERIGGNTRGLSGGQQQRLMIARLLLRRVSLILLDEATSALDVDMEEQVAEGLMHLDEDITVVVVSHRFSAIRGCGKVIVINGGEIEAVGSHEEMRAKSVTYRRLFGKEGAA